MKNELINTISNFRGQELIPNPIQRRECKCGCGHEFQPNRKDQLYINKKHYDFDYNNTKRKVKNKHIVEVEKVLRLNNRILEKHYQSHIGNQKKEPVTCYYDILKADGFLSAHYTGKSEQEKHTYFCLYDFYFRLYKNINNMLIIEIYKA